MASEGKAFRHTSRVSVTNGREGPTYILSMIRQRIIQGTVNEIKTDETRNDFSTKNKADESRWRDGVSALCDCLKNASKIGRDNTVSALFELGKAHNERRLEKVQFAFS